MTLLRVVLFAILGWYLLKWLAGWIADGIPSRKPGKSGTEGKKYKDLTDQTIDDADYEDL